MTCAIRGAIFWVARSLLPRQGGDFTRSHRHGASLWKNLLVGGLVTFAQEEQDATAILWLSVGFWAFFALLCWNSLYPAFLLMFPNTAWARIGAAFTDAALDLGYILTYLGMASWFKFGLTSFTRIVL